MTAVRKMLNSVLWYARELTGEAEYDRYCSQHRRRHPDTPLPTRREYQQRRTTQRECESPNRCC